MLRGYFVRFRKIIPAMFLIVTICSGWITAMFNVYSSVKNTFSRYIADCGVADAVIATEVTAQDGAAVLRGIPGIEKAESRLTGVAQFYSPSGRLLSAYAATLDSEEIQRLNRWIQVKLASDEVVLVDKVFAEKNGMNVGNEILMLTENGLRPFRIAALVSAPETLFGSRLSGLFSRYPGMGFIYVPVSLLEKETEKELSRMMAEWESKHDEYRKLREEAEDVWKQGEQELSEARRELENRQEAFSRSRTELQQHIKTLTDARARLMIGKMEMTDAEDEAARQKTELESTLARAGEELLSMEDRQAELEEIRNDLNALLTRLEDARGRLIMARNRIALNSGTLQLMLKTLQDAKTAWNALRSSGAAVQLPENVLPGGKISAAEIEEMLSKQGVTPETLDETISKISYGSGRLKAGLNRIQDALGQISRTWLPEVQAYLEETEQGLELVYQTRDMLKSGVEKIENGLQALEDFEAQEPENRQALEERLKELSEGLDSVYAGLEEGKTTLEEGREQLDARSEELGKARQESEASLSEDAENLEEALEELKAWEGYTPLRNEFLITFSPDVQDRQAVLDAAAAALGSVVKDSELYENSQLQAKIRQTLDSWDTMAVFIPGVFLIIAVMVLFLLSSMTVRRSRREIGILRALGFRPGQIRGLFCTACLILSVPSLAAGLALGIPLRNAFIRLWLRDYSFPTPVYAFDFSSAALTVLALLLSMQLAVLFSTLRAGRIQPAKITGRRAGGVPLQFFAPVLCAAASVAILFFALSFSATTGTIEKELFSTRFHFDSQVLFSEMPAKELEEEIRNAEYVEKLETAENYEPEVFFGGRSLRIPLTALDAGGSLLTVPDGQGRPMALPESGLVFPAAEAAKLGIRPGDTVTMGGLPVKVAALSRQAGAGSCYCSLRQAAALGAPSGYLWLLKLKGDTEEELIDRLYREKGYVTTVVTRVLAAAVHDSLESRALYARILTGFAVLLALLFVFSLCASAGGWMRFTQGNRKE